MICKAKQLLPSAKPTYMYDCVERERDDERRFKYVCSQLVCKLLSQDRKLSIIALYLACPVRIYEFNQSVEYIMRRLLIDKMWSRLLT